MLESGGHVSVFGSCAAGGGVFCHSHINTVVRWMQDGLLVSIIAAEVVVS